MRYFTGEAHDLGNVTALRQQTFEELCEDVLEHPTRLALTRQQFHALPRKDKTATLDQDRAKRVRYVVPGAYPTTPHQRTSAGVVRSNLIALDIDNAKEAARLLTQRWDEALPDLGYIVWHTASSTPEAPRLRLLVNADGLTSLRYTAAARTIAEMIGMTNVNSGVTFHPAQPMFLPTVFAGESVNPIVASNPTGEPFRLFDIIDDAESSLVDAVAPTAPDAIGDIEYLRAPLEGVTIEHAREALAVLDPDMPMQPWIEMAAALKHQFDNHDAYKVWDEWSSKGKKYTDAKETKYRWDSLKAQPTDRAPVTIRSLFKQAQARGWVNPTLAKAQHQSCLTWLKSPARSAEELLDQGAKRIAKIGPTIGQLEKKTLMVALRDTLSARDVPLPLPDIKRAVRDLELEAARTTGVPPWAKGLCYITALNVFYRAATDRQFSPEVLDLMYSTPQIGDDKPMLPRHYVTQIANCPQVENRLYDPAKADKRFFTLDGVPFVNTYRSSYAPADPTRADEAGEIFYKHIKMLVMEEEYQRLLIDFIAYHVQHPGKKIRWAVVLQSTKGAGKTALSVALSAVLGRRNVKKVSAKSIMEGAHNDWAYGSQVVTVEEVRIVGQNRHAVMDNLKPCISDDDIDLHCKFESHRTVPNITNYMMFTNYQDSLAIDDEERRYFVLASRIQRVEQIRALGSDYFNTLFGMIRDNPGGLRSWLEQWRFSSEFEPDGRAPHTPYLTDLVENAQSPLAAAVRHCIDDQPHALVQKDLLSLSCLRGVLDSSHLPDFSDQALCSVLREMGWQKQIRCMIEGGKHQLWVKKEFPDVRGTAEARLKFL